MRGSETVIRVVGWTLAAVGGLLVLIAVAARLPPNENGFVPMVVAGLMLAAAAILLLAVPKTLREHNRVGLVTLALGGLFTLAGSFVIVWGPPGLFASMPFGNVLAFGAALGFLMMVALVITFGIVRPLTVLLARLLDRVPFVRRHGGGDAFVGRGRTRS